VSGTHLVLDGRRPHSRDVAGFVAALAARTGLGRQQTYRLRLAADEITTNVVVHGYRRRGGPILLKGGAGPTMVWVRVEDEAPPFDPRTHDPSARLATGPNGGATGGFGLFLALRCLDRFMYEYCDGRNRCTLWVRR
jgi:serine/threonine-protein kinase RsbW